MRYPPASFLKLFSTAVEITGHIQQELALYQGARDSFIQALDLDKRIYSDQPEDPRIAYGLNNLGSALQDQAVLTNSVA